MRLNNVTVIVFSLLLSQSVPTDLTTLTTQSLIRTFLRLSSDFQESFIAYVRGPAKYQVGRADVVCVCVWGGG